MFSMSDKFGYLKLVEIKHMRDTNMPLISLDTLLGTISAQAQEIDELKIRIAELEAMLENQSEEALAGELAALIFNHPEDLENVIIASTDFH